MIDQYLNSCLAQGHSVRTIDHYRYEIEHYLMWLAGRPFDDPALLTAYLVAMRRKGHEPATVHGHYRVLRSWFGWLYKHGHVSANPITHVPPPRVPLKEPKRAQLDEYNLLMESIGHSDWIASRDRLIVSVLFLCGLRRSECANLTYSDFRTPEHLLLVRQGKGKKDRIVPVLPAVERAFVEYLFVRPVPVTQVTSLLIGADGAGKHNGLALSSGAIYLMLRRRCAAAGLRMLNPHSFRHGLAMYLLNEGGDMSLVQKILGHAEISTTAKFYAEWLDDGVSRKFTEKMGKLGR